MSAMTTIITKLVTNLLPDIAEKLYDEVSLLLTKKPTGIKQDTTKLHKGHWDYAQAYYKIFLETNVKRKEIKGTRKLTHQDLTNHLNRRFNLHKCKSTYIRFIKVTQRKSLGDGTQFEIIPRTEEE